MKTHVEIHAGNLLHNLRLFRGKSGKPVMLAVKANAYGHGLAEILAIIGESSLVDWIAVDSAAEAAVCRAAGITKPLLVIGWSDSEELTDLFAHGHQTVIASPEQLELAKKISQRLPKPCRFHMKIETGTGRLGIDPARIPGLLKRLDGSRMILTGVYSHFANIEDTTDPSFAFAQLDLFKKTLALMPGGIIRHFSCSASTLLFPETHFDLVRVGISAYGYWPSKPTLVSFLEKNPKPAELKPVLAWKSRVAQVKELKKGSSVGYGLSYKTYSKSRIIVIPVGYYDGYDRKLSNVASVLVGGKRAPIRGRICMNMMMADVSHIPGVREGDAVTLIGRDGREVITADHLGELCGTISYEILARINPILPRRIIAGREKKKSPELQESSMRL
jgi:alanine racemase